MPLREAAVNPCAARRLCCKGTLRQKCMQESYVLIVIFTTGATSQQASAASLALDVATCTLRVPVLGMHGLCPSHTVAHIGEATAITLQASHPLRSVGLIWTATRDSTGAVDVE